VGSDSPAADFEILLMMRNTLKAIGAGEVTIHVNHRGLFNRFLEKINVRDKSADILRTVDKIAKIGKEETLSLLGAITGADNACNIIDYIEPKENFDATLSAVTKAAGGGCPESERLSLIRRFMLDTGSEGSFVLDPSITRGLDYYTGIVYETFLNELPGIGSVCSGGRYDDLAGLYMKEQVSGVGSSIGLDRLIAALESLGDLKGQGSYAKAVIACLREEDGGLYQALAEKFRAAGINCEVFPGTPAETQQGRGSPPAAKKLTQQFILAEKKGIPWVIIPGSGENSPFVPGSPLTLRNLAARENREGLSFEEILQAITL
jgi:histidyl-tRNA synthetase